MNMFDLFLGGLAIAVQPTNLFYCFLGTVVGTLIGVLPGIGTTATLALLLPVTYHLNPTTAIIMLCGINYGSMFGGSTTSILVNIPGEASSIVTCFDGYQMARKGRAGAALGIAALGSFIAGTVSVALLMFVAPTLARAALKFGSPEYFSLMLMAMLMVTFLVKGSMVKALIMVGLGLLLGTVGMDIITGTDRFTYGWPVLRNGLDIFPIVLGLYSVAMVLQTIGTSVKMDVYDKKLKGYLPTRQDWKDSGGPIARGTLLGFLLGIFPGMSTVMATFLDYGIEKRVSKHPEKFGTGAIQGVAGPESCNNASAIGGYVPLFALGLPSNSINAILLGALIIYGLTPGPMLIKNHPDFFWGIIASMYIGNVMCLILNLPLIPIWVQVLRIPYNLLSVIILIFIFLGAYSVSNNFYNVYFAFIFGIFGYLLRKYKFDPAPLVLAYILGPQLEMTFGQSMILSEGSFLTFFDRPISAFFMLMALGLIVLGFTKKRTFAAKQQKEE
jgi:putative tricarboxylic transport membrane protein